VSFFLNERVQPITAAMCTITVPEPRAFNPESHGFFLPEGWWVWVFIVVMIFIIIIFWGVGGVLGVR